ncbi:MAG TPA: Ig-like domain-containing protein [Gemmatimonadaceae bacterium]
MIRLTAGGPSLAGAIACVALMMGCGSESTGPGAVPVGLSSAVVSSPNSGGLVYVGLGQSGTTPGLAIVANRTTGASFQNPLVSGGFDPRTIAANVGDTLWITRRYSAKDSNVAYAVVPQRSQPKVIRTMPAEADGDVNVQDSLVAILSEPVDDATLAAGVGLQPVGGSPLAAAVSDCGNGLCARLVPSVPLPGNSSFQFFISAALTSRNGAVAAVPFSVSFTTGAPTSWPAGLGAAPLVVRSFSVIEFEQAGDTVHYYAPLLTVLNSGTTSADLATFDFSVPGLGSYLSGVCDAITVAPGDSAVVFLGWRGYYDVTVGQPGKRPTGNPTATLEYFSSGYFADIDLTSAITPGEPPADSGSPTQPQRWSYYCP